MGRVLLIWVVSVLVTLGPITRTLALNKSEAGPTSVGECRITVYIPPRVTVTRQPTQTNPGLVTTNTGVEIEQIKIKTETRYRGMVRKSEVVVYTPKP